MRALKIIAIIIALGFLAWVLFSTVKQNKPSVYVPKLTQTQIKPTIDKPASNSAVLGVRTKVSGCAINGALPDKDCTPGAVIAGVTKDQICVSGYASSVRNVSVQEKKDVYEEYGLSYPQPRGAYEVDHLISLELGGSNDISNLWLEAAEPTPGFHQKDIVENYLHEQVCSGMLSLQDAQYEISHDWISVYQKMGK